MRARSHVPPATSPRAVAYRLLAAAVVAASGCASVYQPPALHGPMLEQEGDLHVSAVGGTPGGQVHGSYALTDELAVRGLLQSYGSRNESHYFHHGSVGASLYRGGSGDAAGGTWGLRYAVSLDTGMYVARGRTRVDLFGGTSSVTHRGTGWRNALQGELGFASPYFDAGLGLRASYLLFFHDEESDRPGERARMLMAEPVLFVRPGHPMAKLDLQFGVSIPLPIGHEGSIGLPLPVMLAGGVALDF